MHSKPSRFHTTGCSMLMVYALPQHALIRPHPGHSDPAICRLCQPQDTSPVCTFDDCWLHLTRSTCQLAADANQQQQLAHAHPPPGSALACAQGSAAQLHGCCRSTLPAAPVLQQTSAAAVRNKQQKPLNHHHRSPPHTNSPGLDTSNSRRCLTHPCPDGCSSCPVQDPSPRCLSSCPLHRSCLLQYLPSSAHAALTAAAAALLSTCCPVQQLPSSGPWLLQYLPSSAALPWRRQQLPSSAATALFTASLLLQ
jgi:hypothetical protein